MPPPELIKSFTPSYQPQSQTSQTQPSTTTTQPTPNSGVDADRSASASTSTLPPLDAEFLAELDFSGTGGAAAGGAGAMWTGDGIDWDALMSDGELWNNIGGGWNEGDLTGGYGG
jgi:hypothetical protein